MKEFDFDDIGKKTPYRTPDGFFEKMEAKVMQQAVGGKQRRRRLRLVISGVMAMAAILTGLLFLPFAPQDGTETKVPASRILAAQTNLVAAEPMDQWINEISDEELEELVNLSESDIFLD